nr:integrase, catalytic region, zinc finger, CCHC-type, peptidase aspartic, catalytic [Tanacetum cinerariifolium]
MTESPFVDSGFVIPVFSPGDDLIAYLNKSMVFLTAVAFLRFPSTNNQLRTSSNLRNQATIQDDRVTVQQVRGDKGKIILTKDLDTYDFDCDDLSTAQAVLMANISNYGSEVILEEQADILRGIVEQAKAKQPLDNVLEFACKHTKRIQELLVYVQDTCPSAIKLSETKNTLAEYMILSGADNRPPMLDKNFEHGPLIWPTVEENGVFRTKKYDELSAAEKIHVDCDMKATNIILQEVAYQSPPPTAQHMTESPFVDSGFVVPVFSPGDDPIAYLNKSMPKRPRNAAWYKEKAMLLEAQEAGQMLDEEQLTKDLDTYDFDCDDLSTAQAVLMANISNYGSEVILELRISNPTIESSSTPPVKLDISSELHKASLVNESLKKLKFQLAQFDFVVKKRTTPNALTEGLKCSTSNCRSKPTGNKKNDRISQTPSQTFTTVDTSCPLTRITSTNIVPPKQTPSYSVEIQKPKIKVYNRKPENVKNVGSSKMAKIVESKNANHSKPNRTWDPLQQIFHRTVRFGNDQIPRIMRYGDFQLGNVIISRVYYIEGLGQNLFSVGQ